MGNTSTNYAITQPSKDHPHIHGEYLGNVWLVNLTRGSPPHTWGIRVRQGLALTIQRITPTYMGNTWLAWWFCSRSLDHPHIHGEYCSAVSSCSTVPGSPPHTWGIPMISGSSTICLRITPTYMGNTSPKVAPPVASKDHPHIHGEYQIPLAFYRDHPGSPPHTWGILLPLKSSEQISRITPTYMGNTKEVVVNQFGIVDHPHIHGEYCRHRYTSSQ